jgi:hypothetical protein
MCNVNTCSLSTIIPFILNYIIVRPYSVKSIFFTSFDLLIYPNKRRSGIRSSITMSVAPPAPFSQSTYTGYCDLNSPASFPGCVSVNAGDPPNDWIDVCSKKSLKELKLDKNRTARQETNPCYGKAEGFKFDRLHSLPSFQKIMYVFSKYLSNMTTCTQHSDMSNHNIKTLGKMESAAAPSLPDLIVENLYVDQSLIILSCLTSW